MEHFNEFIIELQTLDIRLLNLPNGDYLDLSHYHQHRSDYDATLKELQQRALTDILSIAPDKIGTHLSRLGTIEMNFAKFWDIHQSLYPKLEKGFLPYHEIELGIYPLFIVHNHKKGIVNIEFLNGFHDPVMIKTKYLSAFTSQVLEILGDKLDNPDLKVILPELQNEITVRHCVLYLYEAGEKLNKNSYISKLMMAKFSSGTSRNAFMELEKYLDKHKAGTKDLTDGERKTFEDYLEQIRNSEFAERIKSKLNLA